ncbi:MAG: methyltransferase domain-containing protein [Thermodesulfobacteriota bacterium]
MHQSSLANMRSFRERFLEARRDDALVIFDIGSCDVNGSYRPLFEEPRWSYRGVDLEAGKNVDLVIRDPYHWREIAAASADVVISGQAFEHIEYFWLTMLEVHRVLKTGGLCCIIAPSSGPEHRFPVDCWRFYGDGFRSLARFAGLDVVEIGTTSDFSPFTDGSKMWKDTVFIGRKPVCSLAATWRARVKQMLLRRLMMAW